MSHPIPTDHRSITPHLIIKDASAAIDFYRRAFGAEELSRMPFPELDGSTKVGHAELRLGDSKLFLSDEFPERGALGPQGGSPVMIHLFVEDARAAFARAVGAGATVRMPLIDMFWGDRYGMLVDPFGHHWSIAEHLEDPTPEQIRERVASFSSEGD